MSPFPEIESRRSKLVLERSKMITALETFTPAELLHAEEGVWSVKDILAHVAHSETLNVKFTRLMLERDKTTRCTRRKL